MYSPAFEGPIEGYVMNFINKHCWKVARAYQREDLKQEAYLIFLRCVGKYPDLETPQHFMALFKTAWNRHFIDLANEDTASRILVQAPVATMEDGYEVPYEIAGDTDHDGHLSLLLEQAPREISMVLNLFLNAPQEILDLSLGSWNGRDRRYKAGGSQRICQMLGLPQNRDVLKEVEEYFQHT